MSNVLPFRPRPAVATLARCEVVAVAGDLLTLLEQLEDVSARAACHRPPPIEVERTVQHLLDAISAVERALDCVGEGEQVARPEPEPHSTRTGCSDKSAQPERD